jgi:hypothetical protein
MFLALALWGAVHPMVWYLRFMRETGGGLPEMIDAWYANASTTGLAWDLTIASAALVAWGLSEAWARRDGLLLIPLPLILAVGLSFALPLYLFLRSRAAPA